MLYVQTLNQRIQTRYQSMSLQHDTKKVGYRHLCSNYSDRLGTIMNIKLRNQSMMLQHYIKTTDYQRNVQSADWGEVLRSLASLNRF